jgi:hypothetical protein
MRVAFKTIIRVVAKHPDQGIDLVIPETRSPCSLFPVFEGSDGYLNGAVQLMAQNRG